MAFPTRYTDATLLAYMLASLGSVGDILGFGMGTLVLTEAANDVLFDYGITDAADATDMIKIRALARYHAWKTALTEVSLDYNFSDAGAKYDRGQMFDHVEKQLLKFKKDALLYLSDYQIESSTIDWKADPYEFVPLEDKPRIPR